VYSSQVLDHFEHPRNSGVLEAPDATVQLENPACGDVLKLFLKVSDQGIVGVTFQAKGCVPAIACGSALTELVSGKTLAEAAEISRHDVLRKLGGLPDASQHASHLAMDALGALLKKLRSQTGRAPLGQ
jgi:NifU-like protein involved in Fe-S cluster formation